MQSQKAVSAHSTSKQILTFGTAYQNIIGSTCFGARAECHQENRTIFRVHCIGCHRTLLKRYWNVTVMFTTFFFIFTSPPCHGLTKTYAHVTCGAVLARSLLGFFCLPSPFMTQAFSVGQPSPCFIDRFNVFPCKYKEYSDLQLSSCSAIKAMRQSLTMLTF